jgi:threonine synthase
VSDFVLVCRACGVEREAGSIVYACAACGGELVVRYADEGPGLPGPIGGMWSRFDRLPLRDAKNVVTLGEGGTPTLELPGSLVERLGVAAVHVKCEHVNPTGSFKDRVASVALSIAVERDLRGCVGTSSGNGGAAAAAYAARAGLPAVLFALSDTAPQKLLQIRALGAHVYLVEGIGHDASATKRAATTIASLAAERSLFPMLTGGRYSPEAMEGATTIADELAEQAPGAKVVYVPVGGGGLCAAMWRGFSRRPNPPRLVAVQPAGCPTVTRALAGDFDGLTDACTTTVSGLQVATLFDGPGIVEAIRGSGGRLVEVDDEAIWRAQSLLAGAGILVEPAGATALAGVVADAEAGRLTQSSRIAVVATGAGYKDSEALTRLVGGRTATRIRPGEIAEALDAVA